MENQNFTITSDLYLAAFAMARGLKLADVDRAEPRRCIFHLEGSLQDSDLAEFARGTALVELGKFVAAQRRLKRAVYEGL